MWNPTAFCSPVSWFGRSSMKNLRRLNVILRMSILAKSHWCSLWSIFKWFCMAVYAFTCTLMHNSHTLITHHMVHCTKTWPYQHKRPQRQAVQYKTSEACRVLHMATLLQLLLIQKCFRSDPHNLWKLIVHTQIEHSAFSPCILYRVVWKSVFLP